MPSVGEFVGDVVVEKLYFFPSDAAPMSWRRISD